MGPVSTGTSSQQRSLGRPLVALQRGPEALRRRWMVSGEYSIKTGQRS
jgi:hypothetical protein